MKNLYRELKNRQQKEMNAFPLGACFSKEQFADMMQKWGLTEKDTDKIYSIGFGLTEKDTDKIYSIGFGCYIRKSDHAAFHEMLDRHERERKEAIAADKTGEGYICQMFLAELADHEYCITYDYEDTFNALGLTVEEINADKRLLHGLRKATKEYLKHCEDY